MSAESKSQIYPDWALLPSQIQEVLSQEEKCHLWDSNGLLAFRYASSQHRTRMLVDTLKELADKIDTGRDHGVAAAYLSNFLAHSVSLYLRRPGDLQTRDFYVADERHHVHRLVSSMDALQTVCDAMNDLVQVIDFELLHHASPTAHRLNMESLKDELRSSPTKEKPSIKEKIHFSTQILALRAMFTSNLNKQSIAREFMNKMTADCLKRGKYLVLNSEHTDWLPMSNGYDLHLHTLETRRRWLDYHLVGLCNAVSSIQPQDMTIKRLSVLDRERLFGKIPSLIYQLAAGNECRVQSILVSLYLQLLGHNKHKYLIMFMGDGHNGKSLLLTLLRECLGELCAPLHKSILFASGSGQKDLHSGFQIQLDSIRSGIMDDLGPRDTFNEQAVKMIVSPDVEMVMREAGHTRRGASKARYRIACSLLLCCNYGSMPKIQMDQALVNRFRITPFEANFVHQVPKDKEQGKVYYKAEPDLLGTLKKPANLTFFLNYVIMAGRYYYQHNIQKFGEPLVNEAKIQAQLEASLEDGGSLLPASSGVLIKSQNNFKDWWEKYLVFEPGQSVAVGTLAIAYSKTTGIVLRNPSKDFGQLLQSHYPEIARDKKKQLMTVVEGVRSKRMTILDYTLLVELES